MLGMTCSDDGSIRLWDLTRAAATAADPANVGRAISACLWMDGPNGSKIIACADSLGFLFGFNSEGVSGLLGC